MAIHVPHDSLSAMGFPRENPSRAVSVAWLIAAQEDESLQNWNSSNFNFREELAKYINKNSEAGIFIKNNILKRLVPQKHVDWIDSSRRQFFWMNNHISRLHRHRPDIILKDPWPISHQLPRIIPFYLQDLELNIALADYWLVKSFQDLVTSIRYCREINFAWKTLTESDKLFSWVDGIDAERKRECFWNFLKSKHPNHIDDHRKFNSHEDLLIFFDNPSFERDTKELFSQKVRKTWTQRARRENEKDRNQCNFNLPLQTIDKLDKLSKRHGVSRTDIIQILIESEYRNNIHISERLSRKHQLMAPLE